MLPPQAVAIAIVSNAFICGTLSAPIPRYQTRISWLPLFIVVVWMSRFWWEMAPARPSPAPFSSA
jgi:hypothetical protein